MSASDGPVRLIVGLGNPGERYRRTRHNAGRMAVEQLARRLGAGSARERFNAHLWELRGPAGPLSLLTPDTFMNLSGDAVGPAAGSLRVDPEHVLVMHDEIDLPFGTVRAKRGGGFAGHNGLKSIGGGLGSPDFLRLRIGVGAPPPEFRGSRADWVLAAFSEPPDEVERLLTRGVDMAIFALENGLDSAMARFHADTDPPEGPVAA